MNNTLHSLAQAIESVCTQVNKTPQAFPSLALAILPILLLLSLLPAAYAQAKQPSPIFYKTTNSDEWVTHTFYLQNKYSRVLVVDTSGHPPHHVSASLPDLNSAGAVRTVSPHDYVVSAVYKTLQAAADASQGGDLIAVMPGTYAGFVLEDKPSAADGNYIHFKAMGSPGDVIIDRASPNPDWMILLRATHHVIVEGFNLAGHNVPAIDPKSPRAGIMLDGNFGVTGMQTHHVVLIGNFSHNHRKWGFHSRDTHTVLMQDNVFALSAMEHSAYVSDGSDNYVIRRNIFFGSHASGLQCNLDTVSSFHDLILNPRLKGYRREEPTREWALGLIQLATQKFGSNNFPDGKGVNFIIEDNVINENGKAGGGSLNLAGLQDSLIQNNLIYGNFNHGIAQWNDANPYDEQYVDPGPTSPDQAGDPLDLPLWGCHGNTIRNNTVLMSNLGHAAMQCRNGSWGTKMRNNIFINDKPSSMEIFNTSLYRLDSSFSIVNTVSYVDTADPIKSVALSLPEAPRTISGITRAQADKEFVHPNEEPWIIIEGKWWWLNPNRPDFRPKPGSKLFANWGDPTDIPPTDLSGHQRTGASIGALAPASR